MERYKQGSLEVRGDGGMGESRAQIETCRKASPGGADTAGSAGLPGSTD